MSRLINVAIIGLDTSHSIEFSRRMQAPDCPEQMRVAGLRAVSCLTFMTPFTSEQVLEERQQQLEQWGVNVTSDFDEAVADCDAIMLEINDPAFHLEYFRKCMALDKPIFLDKPLANNFSSGKTIYELAQKNQTQVISASSLRHSANLLDACREIGQPSQVYCYGPLGLAPAGSSIVWYGVHSFEMLQKAMGSGAVKVDVRKDPSGVVAVVEYPDSRRGIVELTEGLYTYGGTLRSKEKSVSYQVDASMIYTQQLRDIKVFFATGQTPHTMDDALEVMLLLDAADRSSQQGTPVLLDRLLK